MMISKKISLLILGVTAIAFSRLMFFFFNDPEGPNLLVMGVAAVVYVLSLAIYAFNHRTMVLNKLLMAVLFQIALIGGLFIVGSSENSERQLAYANDHKNASYLIDGKQIKLTNGLAETEAASDSASKIVTRYFGNELKADLNGDGKEDVSFIVTQSSGGSGTFYYAVAALNTADGYVGSDGYLLGDRIAPQSTTISPDASQKNVVVFNFADRAPGEPMTTRPSVGKSVYLKLNPSTMQWGVVLSPEERKSL